jgi:hypothetical protein
MMPPTEKAQRQFLTIGLFGARPSAYFLYSSLFISTASSLSMEVHLLCAQIENLYCKNAASFPPALSCGRLIYNKMLPNA